MARIHRSTLAETIAARYGMHPGEASAIITSLLSDITDHLDHGNSVTLPGFGTFIRRTRHGRTGRNPATGGPVTIPPSSVIGFRPAKAQRHTL